MIACIIMHKNILAVARRIFFSTFYTFHLNLNFIIITSVKFIVAETLIILAMSITVIDSNSKLYNKF